MRVTVCFVRCARNCAPGRTYDVGHAILDRRGKVYIPLILENRRLAFSIVGVGHTNPGPGYGELVLPADVME